MKAKNNKETKMNENPGITSSPSVIPSEDAMPNYQKKIGLAATLNNEDDNEEWLKAKHQILDGRIEYRNLSQ